MNSDFSSLERREREIEEEERSKSPPQNDSSYMKPKLTLREESEQDSMDKKSESRKKGRLRFIMEGEGGANLD